MLKMLINVMINDIKCLFSTLQSIQPVHELFKSTSMKPGMVVIFFHGIGFGKRNEWKDTWTSRTASAQLVCWPQVWLPADLASQNINNVWILSLSYDSTLLLGANSNVMEIGKNLIQSLVSNRYCNLISNISYVETFTLVLYFRSRPPVTFVSFPESSFVPC
jgi:hypothetical protein